jgi:mono/diheme cytochrome c family protein
MLRKTACSVALAGAAALVLLWSPQAHSQASKAKAALPADPHRQLVSTYCLGCHSARAKSGGLVLEGRNLDNVAADAEIWEKVIRKLHGGQMPPQNMPRPDAKAVAAFTEYLETSLDRAVATGADPGRSGLHRLNRSEYANAIRDLLAVEIDPAEYLPPDDEINTWPPRAKSPRSRWATWRSRRSAEWSTFRPIVPRMGTSTACR